ncbi:MAG: Ig-like domain-containing protein [Firmicutes bacterium]|nr:Ig-like domain-containing protein [Bacillota bacterium]
MKKTGLIVCIVTMIAMLVLGSLMMATAEEGGLTLVETYPKDGQKNAAVENLGIKLTFSAPVNLEANQAENSKCFKITGPDGDLNIKVYYNPDIPEQVLVLQDLGEDAAKATAKAKESEEYTVSISGSFKDNEGNTLGEDQKITFKTINAKRNNTVYLVIMGLMMVGMVFFSTRQAKAAATAAAEESGVSQAETFNPYKEAKRTGKSLTQVIAEHDKEVAKQQAKEAKRLAKYEEEYEYEEEVESGIYRVKGPRPISAAGSTYITGRKAAAEARAEEERLAKRRVKNSKKK